MRSLTPVEAALAFAIVGSVLAVSVPSFLKNLHASRLAEPLDGLSRIAARSAQLAELSPQARAYPDSAPLTPEQVPRGDTVTDSPGTWQHPTWRLLGFSFETDHAFSFAYDSKNAEAESSYTARAHGDLDGDGVQSAFSISGMVRPNQTPVTLPLEVSREVE